MPELMNVQLRPLALGEMLDHSFNLYRRDFVLFFGVSMLPALLILIVSLAVDVVGAFLGNTIPGRTPLPGRNGLPDFSSLMIVYLVIGAFAGVMAYYVGIAFSQAAGTRALSSVYLGNKVTITSAFSNIGRIFGRVLGIIGLVALLGIVPMLVFLGMGVGTFLMRNSLSTVSIVALVVFAVFGLAGSLVLAIFISLRYAVAVPTCVIENRAIGDSLRRSSFLMRGNYVNAFVIFLLVGLISMVIGWIFQMPIQIAVLLLFRNSTWLGNLLVHLSQFISTALVAPFQIIAISLLYYDERIRKEAFDIQFMMRESGMASGATQSSAAIIG